MSKFVDDIVEIAIKSLVDEGRTPYIDSVIELRNEIESLISKHSQVITIENPKFYLSRGLISENDFEQVSKSNLFILYSMSDELRVEAESNYSEALAKDLSKASVSVISLGG